MCFKLLDWFNNEFLFIFESKNFKKKEDISNKKLNNNINEPKLSKSYSNTSIKSDISIDSIISNIDTPSSVGLISKDNYDLYTWDIL